MEVAETGGIWPSQISLVTTPMLPKPKGGFRVIGLMPALYRVWAKARRTTAEEWEKRFQRGYFAAAPGTGTVDIAWAQAAKQEAGVAREEIAGMILEDLAAFYEGINRDLLANEAAHLGFPLDIMRASFGMYANPRMIALHGRLAKEVHPRRGIIAGCSFATTYVKVMMVRALDRAVSKMPDGVTLDAYIDDLALAAVGTKEQVASKLAEAHKILREVVREELGCEFAHDKTAIVATCPHVANRLREQVGVQGNIFEAAPNLGIDAPAAKPRRAWNKKALRRSRLVKADRRETRLRRLGNVLGCKAIRIYKSGAEKAGTYGAEVWGLSESEVRRLRKLAAATLRPRGRGRSLTLTLLLAGAPTAAVEVAPMLQYHRMVWNGTVQRERSRIRGTSLGNVSSWWQDTKEYAERLIDMTGYSKRAEGGPENARVENMRGGGQGGRGAAAAWRGVQGPIAAAHLAMARIGWKFDGPFELQDDKGCKIVLTQTAPSLLKELLIEGVRRKMEWRLGETWSKVDAAFE